MRLDGKAFHTLTRGMNKPFDLGFIMKMQETAKKLLKEIQGAKVAYVQSDEISILITDYDKLETDAVFDFNIQKMCSVFAGYASVYFSGMMQKLGIFDCRVFNIPKEEVTNYFIWRQKDWERNSLQMLAQKFFSQKQLKGKKKADIHEMLFQKGKNWSKLKSNLRNGTFIFPDRTIRSCMLTKNRKMIEELLEVKNEN